MHFTLAERLYHNPLATPEDVKGFVIEGQAAITFPKGRMRLASLLDPGEGQKANLVYWCNREFPDHIAVSWDFWPIHEPGLCIIFFAGRGRNGEALWDAALAKRNGEYRCYTFGDINALHVSYFRRKGERAFNTCNLRKSYGFHMVCRGADPIPTVADAEPPYRIQLVKRGPDVAFAINELRIFEWHDDGRTYGPLLGGGWIGFRQMAPMIAEYANLEVHIVT